MSGGVGLPADAPRRLLVVSATVGDGHDAVARAVEERAAALWPRCEIHRIDTLDEMGRWAGPVARGIHRMRANPAPWLSDSLHRVLWRHLWFARASCRFLGAWSGRRLVPAINDVRPDLVVSTSPLGTGGLDWIRRRGGLDVPLAAIVSDFAPHPLWAYADIDLHYVPSEPSLRALHRVRPDARGAVGAPPVVSAFHPVDKVQARVRVGLPVGRPVVLVSGGPLGSGRVERAVDAALRARPHACVVVVCGREDTLRARLKARSEPEHRLVPLGTPSAIPELTAAADVVVTDAAGVTAVEALASARAVLLFEPSAGQGKANAAAMQRAGLARVCHDPHQLVAALAELTGRPEPLAAAERRAVAHIGSLDLQAELAALPGLPRHQPARALDAPDALFVRSSTARVHRPVGAVLVLDRHEPAGPPERVAEQLMKLVAQRAGTLPMLRRRLEQLPGTQARWLPVEHIDAAAHVTARTVGTDGDGCWASALHEFFRAPLPADRPPWQLEVVYDRDAGQTAVLAKVHHALGDGLAITATLIGLLSDCAEPTGRGGAAPLHLPRRTGWRARVRAAGQVLRGVASLARLAGLVAPGRRRPGRSPHAAGPAIRVAGTPSAPDPRLALVELPAATVRAAARAHHTSSSALLLGVLAEALCRRGGAGLAAGAASVPDGRLRTMVPLTTRAVRRPGSGGNNTAALLLHLPVGPMAPDRRISEVAAELARVDRAGQAVASRAVVLALGGLPAPLHARLAHLVYGGRFFSLIASVLPGPRRAHHLLGTRVVSVFPVLPPPDGVGLGVGFLSWGDMIGVGITAEGAPAGDVDGLAEAVRSAFSDIAVVRPSPPVGAATVSGTATMSEAAIVSGQRSEG